MRRNYLIACILLTCIISSCKQTAPPDFTVADTEKVKDSVNVFVANTAVGITQKGPVGWLNYFEDTPNFFMASDGALVFNDHKSAEYFIKNTLIKQLPHITLKWSDVRIDAIAPDVAFVGANFHEDLTDSVGKITPIDGYFTATAHKTINGWRYRNAHWSVKK